MPMPRRPLEDWVKDLAEEAREAEAEHRHYGTLFPVIRIVQKDLLFAWKLQEIRKWWEDLFLHPPPGGFDVEYGDARADDRL